jgi:hypothetical protein
MHDVLRCSRNGLEANGASHGCINMVLSSRLSMHPTCMNGQCRVLWSKIKRGRGVFGAEREEITHAGQVLSQELLVKLCCPQRVCQLGSVTTTHPILAAGLTSSANVKISS